MTFEEALYHKLMIAHGFNYSYENWLNKALNEENPLSDIVLELSTCCSDYDIIAVLNEFLYSGSDINYDIVFNYIWQDLHNIWNDNTIEKETFLLIIHNIAKEVNQTESNNWYTMYALYFLYQEAKNNYISIDSFNSIFEQFIENKVPLMKTYNPDNNNNNNHLTTRLALACVVQLLYPFFLIVGKISGFDFHLNGAAISLLTIILISPLMIGKVSADLKHQRLIKTLLPIIIATNGLLYCFELDIDTSFFLISIISVIICCFYALYKLIKVKNKNIFQKISVAISVILLTVLIFSSVTYPFFNEWGGKSTVKSVLSPNEKYIAEVTDVDQGALGGDTVVYISRKTNDINILIGKFTSAKEIVYIGEWGESADMEIEWKDNNTLLINSKEYPIT